MCAKKTLQFSIYIDKTGDQYLMKFKKIKGDDLEFI